MMLTGYVLVPAGRIMVNGAILNRSLVGDCNKKETLKHSGVTSPWIWLCQKISRDRKSN